MTAHFLFVTDVLVAVLHLPKQARSTRTRARLVEAATQTLVTRGMSGASTAAMAGEAGVSQGALFKHFPTKAVLLAESVAQILAGFIADFRADLAARAGASLREQVAHAVAALWRIFRRDEMQAVLEVYLAARTDAALGATLAPILERHRENILAEAARLFPELAASIDFPGVVDAVVYAMQGVIVGVFSRDDAGDARHLAFFERLALRELEAATGARP